MNLSTELWLCVLTCFLCQDTLSYIRACFFTNWSQFKPVSFNINPKQFPSRLCTHIVFAFADVRGTNIGTTEYNDVLLYARLNRLRRSNPTIQLLLAVGGWAAGGAGFSRLVSNQTNMEQFSNNLVIYLRRYSFDGATVDWQYPTVDDRGGNARDRSRFTGLLANIRGAFEAEARLQNRTRLSLSATMEANITEARGFYETRRVGNFLDWVFLSAYDFYGSWDTSTGAQHHSALFPDIGDFVQGWLQDGFPASKMVLGISGFGRNFTLESEPSGNGQGQSVVFENVSGKSSGDNDLMEYWEVCSNIANNGWRRIWLENQSVPIAYGNTSFGSQWVGYDDRRSLREKAKFIRQNKLAGIVFWSLDRDDFRNICGGGSWPLLRTLAQEVSVDDIKPLVKTTTQWPSSLEAEGRRITTTTNSTDPSPTFNKLHATPVSSKPKSNVEENPRNNFSTTLKTAETTTTTPAENSTFPTSTSTTTTPAKNSTFPTSTSTTTTTMHGSGLNTSEGVFTSSSSVFQGFGFSTEPQKTPTSKSDNATFRTNDKQTITANSMQKQCRVSKDMGPDLICPANRGKPGHKHSFYIFCVSGFLAIECNCLAGHFFNRCMTVCDNEENFTSCPFVY